MAAASPNVRRGVFVTAVLLASIGTAVYLAQRPAEPEPKPSRASDPVKDPAPLTYRPRQGIDTGGYLAVIKAMEPWKPNASLAEVGRAWKGGLGRLEGQLEQHLANPALSAGDRIQGLIYRASAHHYVGHADRAYKVLEEARKLAEADPAAAQDWLYSVVYYQGVTARAVGKPITA